MALKEYHQKRSFKQTPEPKGARKSSRGRLRFVVQKHAATQLHYDFRLELDGVLKSWSVPKGPSFDPSIKRLAMMTEDHPLEYAEFEGVIPEGNYGAGQVIIWDRGTYGSIEKFETRAEDGKFLKQQFKKGDFKFSLDGRKLKGEFVLVKIKHDRWGKNAWLLIKHRDKYASTKDITKQDRSVVSGKRLEDIKNDSKS